MYVDVWYIDPPPPILIKKFEISLVFAKQFLDTQSVDFIVTGDTICDVMKNPPSYHTKT